MRRSGKQTQFQRSLRKTRKAIEFLLNRPSAFLTNHILILIIMLSIILRILAVYPGYPPVHSDEPQIVDQTRRIVLNFDFDPKTYYYGSLLSILYAVGIFLSLPLRFFYAFVTNIDLVITYRFFGFVDYFFQDLAKESLIPIGNSIGFKNDILYSARLEAALLSSFTSLLIYYVGKKLFNKKTGLIAAFLVAVNYRHMLSSTLVLADAPAALFAALSVFLSSRLFKNHTMKDYLLAGVGVGLALSVKYFVYVIPVFLVCHTMSFWEMRPYTFRDKIKKILLNDKLLLSFITAILLFLIINPYLLIHSGIAIEQFHENSARYRLDSETLSHKLSPPFNNLITESSIYPLTYLFHFGIGPLLSIATLIGFIVVWIRLPKQAALLSVAVLPYSIIFVLLAGAPTVRNYSSIIPLVLIFPAAFIVLLCERYLRRSYRNAVIILITGCVAFSSIKNSSLTMYFYSKPSNYTQFVKWESENLSDYIALASTSRVPLGYLGTKAAIDPEALKTNLSFEELKKSNIDAVVVSSDTTNYYNVTHLPQPYYLNQQKLWRFTNDSFVSLFLEQLAQYKTTVFAKPYWQSLEPSFLVTKFPKNWSVRKETLERQFDFKKMQPNRFIGQRKKLPSFDIISSDKAVNEPSLRISRKASEDEGRYIITSNNFPVHPGKWYSFETLAKRVTKGFQTPRRNGFMRLDIFTANGERLATYTSSALAISSEWEVKQGAGLAPKNASYASIGFQLDDFYPDEFYYIRSIEIFSSTPPNGITYSEKRKEAIPRNFYFPVELL